MNLKLLKENKSRGSACIERLGGLADLVKSDFFENIQRFLKSGLVARNC